MRNKKGLLEHVLYICNKNSPNLANQIVSHEFSTIKFSNRR